MLLIINIKLIKILKTNKYSCLLYIGVYNNDEKNIDFDIKIFRII